MLVAIIVATTLFYNKWQNKPDGLDRMAAVLERASGAMGNTSRISFQNYPIVNELHFQARYVMAPRYLPFHKYTYDTTLTITPLQFKDSIRNVLAAAHRTTLWQYTDTSFDYLLTSTH